MIKNKWVKRTGNILMIISLVYIVRMIFQNRENLLLALNADCLWLILLLVGLCVITIHVFSFVFSMLLSKITDKKLPVPRLMYIYMEANLYKYLPGNVMHYVGRNKMVTEGFASFEQLNATSVIEVLMNICAAFAVGFLFSFGYILDYLSAYLDLHFLLLAGAVVLTVCVAIYILNRKKITALLGQLFNRRTLPVMLLMFFVLFANNFTNYLFVLLLRLLGYSIPSDMVLPVIGICAISWLIGFITPGAPGGIGVREAMLSVLLASIVPIWVVSSAAVILRITQIIGEVLAFVVSRITMQTKEKKHMSNQEWASYKDSFAEFQDVTSNLIYGEPSSDTPEISIMIPTYRRADQLAKALNSALHQTASIRCEIAVIDNDPDVDAATDELMKASCAKYENLLYYRNDTNIGMCGNWNRSIELSRSNIFCILHDDDLLLPKYIQCIYPIAKATHFGAIGVFSSFFYHSNQDVSDYRKATDRQKEWIGKIRGNRLIPFELLDAVCDMRPSPTACLYNKKACLELGGFDFRKLSHGMASDNWFFCAMRTKYPVYIFPQLLALRGMENNDSMDPDVVTEVLKGAHTLNNEIIKNIKTNKRLFYNKLNDIMVFSLFFLYKQTYGVDLDEAMICNELGIPERIRNTPAWKIKLLRIFLWGKALLRPEPEDAKKARRQMKHA